MTTAEESGAPLVVAEVVATTLFPKEMHAIHPVTTTATISTEALWCPKVPPSVDSHTFSMNPVPSYDFGTSSSGVAISVDCSCADNNAGTSSASLKAENRRGLNEVEVTATKLTNASTPFVVSFAPVSSCYPFTRHAGVNPIVTGRVAPGSLSPSASHSSEVAQSPLSAEHVAPNIFSTEADHTELRGSVMTTPPPCTVRDKGAEEEMIALNRELIPEITGEQLDRCVLASNTAMAAEHYFHSLASDVEQENWRHTFSLSSLEGSSQPSSSAPVSRLPDTQSCSNVLVFAEDQSSRHLLAQDTRGFLDPRNSWSLSDLTSDDSGGRWAGRDSTANEVRCIPASVWSQREEAVAAFSPSNHRSRAEPAVFAGVSAIAVDAALSPERARITLIPAEELRVRQAYAEYSDHHERCGGAGSLPRRRLTGVPKFSSPSSLAHTKAGRALLQFLRCISQCAHGAVISVAAPILPAATVTETCSALLPIRAEVTVATAPPAPNIPLSMPRLLQTAKACFGIRRFGSLMAAAAARKDRHGSELVGASREGETESSETAAGPLVELTLDEALKYFNHLKEMLASEGVTATAQTAFESPNRIVAVPMKGCKQHASTSGDATALPQRRRKSPASSPTMTTTTTHHRGSRDLPSREARITLRRTASSATRCTGLEGSAASPRVAVAHGAVHAQLVESKVPPFPSTPMPPHAPPPDRCSPRLRTSAAAQRNDHIRMFVARKAFMEVIGGLGGGGGPRKAVKVEQLAEVFSRYGLIIDPKAVVHVCGVPVPSSGRPSDIAIDFDAFARIVQSIFSRPSSSLAHCVSLASGSTKGEDGFHDNGAASMLRAPSRPYVDFSADQVPLRTLMLTTSHDELGGKAAAAVNVEGRAASLAPWATSDAPGGRRDEKLTAATMNSTLAVASTLRRQCETSSSTAVNKLVDSIYGQAGTPGWLSPEHADACHPCLAEESATAALCRTIHQWLQLEGGGAVYDTAEVPAPPATRIFMGGSTSHYGKQMWSTNSSAEAGVGIAVPSQTMASQTSAPLRTRKACSPPSIPAAASAVPIRHNEMARDESAERRRRHLSSAVSPQSIRENTRRRPRFGKKGSQTASTIEFFPQPQRGQDSYAGPPPNEPAAPPHPYALSATAQTASTAERVGRAVDPVASPIQKIFPDALRSHQHHSRGAAQGPARHRTPLRPQPPAKSCREAPQRGALRRLADLLPHHSSQDHNVKKQHPPHRVHVVHGLAQTGQHRPLRLPSQAADPMRGSGFDTTPPAISSLTNSRKGSAAPMTRLPRWGTASGVSIHRLNVAEGPPIFAEGAPSPFARSPVSPSPPPYATSGVPFTAPATPAAPPQLPEMSHSTEDQLLGEHGSKALAGRPPLTHPISAHLLEGALACQPPPPPASTPATAPDRVSQRPTPPLGAPPEVLRSPFSTQPARRRTWALMELAELSAQQKLVEQRLDLMNKTLAALKASPPPRHHGGSTERSIERFPPLQQERDACVVALGDISVQIERYVAELSAREPPPSGQAVAQRLRDVTAKGEYSPSASGSQGERSGKADVVNPFSSADERRSDGRHEAARQVSPNAPTTASIHADILRSRSGSAFASAFRMPSAAESDRSRSSLHTPASSCTSHPSVPIESASLVEQDKALSMPLTMAASEVSAVPEASISGEGAGKYKQSVHHQSHKTCAAASPIDPIELRNSSRDSSVPPNEATPHCFSHTGYLPSHDHASHLSNGADVAADPATQTSLLSTVPPASAPPYSTGVDVGACTTLCQCAVTANTPDREQKQNVQRGLHLPALWPTAQTSPAGGCEEVEAVDALPIGLVSTCSQSPATTSPSSPIVAFSSLMPASLSPRGDLLSPPPGLSGDAAVGFTTNSVTMVPIFSNVTPISVPSSGKYEDDSPNPTAHVYLEWTDMQRQRRNQFKPIGTANAATGPRWKWPPPPPPSLAGTSQMGFAVRAGAKTSVTSNSSHIISKAHNSAGGYPRPPMGGSRSIVTSTRVLFSSQGSSKRSNDLNGSSSTVRNGGASQMPTSGSVLRRGAESQSRDRGGAAVTIPMADESGLLSLSSGDRASITQRGQLHNHKAVLFAASSNSHANNIGLMTTGSLDSCWAEMSSRVSAPLEFLNSSTCNGAKSTHLVPPGLHEGSSSTIPLGFRLSGCLRGSDSLPTSASRFSGSLSCPSIPTIGYCTGMYPQRDSRGGLLPVVEDDAKQGC